MRNPDFADGVALLVAVDGRAGTFHTASVDCGPSPGTCLSDEVAP